MINVKAISISAICGFVLSFIFGLFSHSKFIMVLVKALIFALIFGAIGLLVSFLYKKFLVGDSTQEFSSGNEGDAGAAPVKGQRVNLVVEDQEFERGESDNHFVVGENHQMLNESDYGKSEQSSVDSNPSFVPLRKHETVENISGKEAAINDPIPNTESSSVTQAMPVSNAGNGIPTLQDEPSGGLDVLPDMDNLTMNDNVITATESGDSNMENEGFSSEEGFSSVGSSRRSKNEDQEVQDAGIMAKAISSILSSEE